MAETISRRSPVHAHLEHLQPVWGQAGNMPVALRFKDLASEALVKQDLALADLSCLQKVGFKGQGTLRWLAEQNVTVPEGVYEASDLANGGLIVRTDRNEVFLEDGFAGKTVARLIESFSS